MLQPYLPSLYRTHDAQTPAPAPESVPGLFEEVDKYTTRLTQDPYNPQLWTSRASAYLALNYPELAAGDAYKAKLLLERGSTASAQDGGSKSINSSTEHAGDEVQKTKTQEPQEEVPKRPHIPSNHAADADDEAPWIKTYEVLGQALYDAHCHVDSHTLWASIFSSPLESKFPLLSTLARSKETALSSLLEQKQKAAAALGGSAWAQHDRLRDGSVRTVTYPWLEERHRVRSAELVERVNDEMRRNVQPPACRVARSTLAREGEEDVLGVFATRRIAKGECFLVDRTSTCAATAPPTPCCANCYAALSPDPRTGVGAHCCTARFCSPPCLDTALSTHHAALCSQDFTWLTAPAVSLRENASPMRPLLMLRILALCTTFIADDRHHPLSHPLLARLQPLSTTTTTHLDVFTLPHSLTHPLKTLTQLGINIFTSPLASPLTLHTLWTRLANNKTGSFAPDLGFTDAVYPFLPLFNHACAPNVESRREEGCSTVRFFAGRDVQPGEELFDSYVDVGGLGVGERWERLVGWFEGGCRCERCVGEGGDGIDID